MNQQHYKYHGSIDHHNNFKEELGTARDHHAAKSISTKTRAGQHKRDHGEDCFKERCLQFPHLRV